VLSALAIADELYSLRQQKIVRDDSLRESAKHCLTLLERALKQTA
jgi:hypothetical protein